MKEINSRGNVRRTWKCFFCHYGKTLSYKNSVLVGFERNYDYSNGKTYYRFGVTLWFVFLNFGIVAK